MWDQMIGRYLLSGYRPCCPDEYNGSEGLGGGEALVQEEPADDDSAEGPGELEDCCAASGNTLQAIIETVFG